MGDGAAARYKPVRVNNRPSDVIAPRDTSVAFKWLLSRLCLDADVDLWNSIKLHGIPYRPNRVVASQSKHPPDPSLPPPPPPPVLRLSLPYALGCYCDFLCCSCEERARAFAVTFFFYPDETEKEREREDRGGKGFRRKNLVLPFYLCPLLPNRRSLCRTTGHSEGRKI